MMAVTSCPASEVAMENGLATPPDAAARSAISRARCFDGTYGIENAMKASLAVNWWTYRGPDGNPPDPAVVADDCTGERVADIGRANE